MCLELLGTAHLPTFIPQGELAGFVTTTCRHGAIRVIGTEVSNRPEVGTGSDSLNLIFA